MTALKMTKRESVGGARLGLERYRIIWVFVVAFVVASCGDGGGAATEGNTYTVGVDGSTDEFNGAFFGFFPDRLRVHAGDTIVFERPENGEPHTVALGPALPMSAVPGGNFFSGGFGGRPRLDTSMPCFLSDGRPAGDGCSPAERQPVAFDGTQTWFNSGGLLADEQFTLELSDDIEPGTYDFFCLVHTEEMRGRIEVVEPGEEADDPAEVSARGIEQLQMEVNRIRSRFDSQPILGEGEVLAAFHDGTFTAWAITFTPEEIEIPVGGTVKWRVMGDHTITFNAPESARPFYERAEDGSIRENELAAEQQGDASGWDGSGIFNSGLRSGVPDRLEVTFTRPGTYAYLCTIHFGMEGRVKVIE